MLPPRNLLIVSLAIFLATTVSLAPVEEKEREEAELEATEEVEGELSEEEEDDDDSQSQHKIKGNLGTQQTITSVAAAGGSVSGGPSAGMGPNDGVAGSSAGLHGAAFSVNSAAAGGPSSSSGSASSAGSTGPVGSAGYPGSVESSGSIGSAGSAGSADHLGSAGSSGSVDPAGSAGSPGHLGSAGSSGSVDPAGSAGSPVHLGSAGSSGSVDPAGSAGSPGHLGSAGSSGSVDPAGSAGSPGHLGSAGSVDSAGSAGHPGFAGSPGSVDSAGSSASGAAAVHLSDVSAGQTHLGSDRVDSMFNVNGQKLLNGGGLGVGGGGEGVGAHSQTGSADFSGVLGTFGGGVSQLSHTGGSPAGEMNTGIIDPSSHDYLLGLMGGGLIHHFSTGAHDPGQKTPPTHLDSTGISSGVTEAPFGDKNILDPPAGPGSASLSSGPGHTLPVDQPGPGGSSPGSGPDQQTLSNDRLGPDGFSFVSGPDHSLLRPASGSSLSAAGLSSSLDNGAFREQTEEAESADNNGNGRQILLTDNNGAVTDRAATSSDLGSLQTDLTGGAAESVTRLHSPDPASTMEPARDVTATESSLGALHTESAVGVAHTLSGVSGIYSHTDFITVTADFIGRSTADPTGTPFDSSHPVVTDHTQMAGSVTEQYNPSGQGPEGAENVELEDTC
ncbi:collagen alpha-2(I) chain isoform X3 [Oryzias latipes]|uniref:collagen alpha-2(I) chain isoform X3 n=1 Tax=Oryzias latipes TaxID=8090 RepID=UPI000CE24964|nr:collagen alpha-2(I) chain isoform X3 [Oryzias latipes]